MKKLTLILSFACFLIAGSQLSFAQTIVSQSQTAISDADASVKKNAQKVINMLERDAKLEASQKEKIYDVFVAVNKKMKGIEAIEDASEKASKKAKMQTYIDQKMKQILTKDQYTIYSKKMAAH